jgi:hypothetical protein
VSGVSCTNSYITRAFSMYVPGLGAAVVAGLLPASSYTFH